MVVQLGILTIGFEILGLCGLIFSLAFPKRRIWPPPSAVSWQAVVMNLLFYLSATGLLLLGILEWGALSVGSYPAVRIACGVLIWSAGFGLSLWSIRTLGWRGTSGEKIELMNRGPYRYSRNPQSVGYLMMLIGWNLVIASAWVLAAAAVAGIVLWIIPLVEEPYLRENHAFQFEQYCQKTPRWLFF
jgi:protein-S-isoprenylcysteine O-methyltransferase Ste14